MYIYWIQTSILLNNVCPVLPSGRRSLALHQRCGEWTGSGGETQCRHSDVTSWTHVACENSRQISYEGLFHVRKMFVLSGI